MYITSALPIPFFCASQVQPEEDLFVINKGDVVPKKITLSEFRKEKPDYKNSSISKEKLVLNWLVEWVENSLQDGAIEYGDTMPLKCELAKLLEVSVGTIQNAIRHAEDLGYFESKQRIGTLIKDRAKTAPGLNKMFSKKDKASVEIKKILSEYEIGTVLPPVRILSGKILASTNTTRLALESLLVQGVLEQKPVRGNECHWCLKQEVRFEAWEKEFYESSTGGVDNKTLSKKLEAEIKKFIKENYKKGEKIPSNEELARHFQVSIRTINDATKVLQEDGVILSRRGQYGTIYIGEEARLAKEKERAEKSIFMTSEVRQKTTGLMTNPLTKQKTLPKNQYLYNWEITVKELKKHIMKGYEVGDKIPSMRDLAQTLKVSTNTVRTAVFTLCSQNILYTQRGKYGGTYIVNMPEKDSDAFTWLALNPKFIEHLPN